MSSITESISFLSADARLAGYVARPAGDEPSPGVVVIHEVYGLNDNIKQITERFAGEGYAAMAVDLFAGRNRAVCMARFFAGLFLNSLDHGGIRDLKAALTWLAAQPYIDGERLGAIGFCMGGSFAVAWACTDDRLRAIAPYYGVNPRPLTAVARSCPVVGSYPEQDFTAKQGRQLDITLDQYQIPHDIKIYRDTKHSFFNDQGRTYDAAASADAWQRVLRFFGEYLGSADRSG